MRSFNLTLYLFLLCTFSLNGMPFNAITIAKPVAFFFAGAMAGNFAFKQHCKLVQDENKPTKFNIMQNDIAMIQMGLAAIPFAISTLILIFKSKVFWQKAFSIFSTVATFAQKQTT